jgi:hypothetical protein
MTTTSLTALKTNPPRRWAAAFSIGKSFSIMRIHFLNLGEQYVGLNNSLYEKSIGRFITIVYY